MKYLYPKLSSKDFCLFRLGGAGLGNILFTYARAVVYAKKHPDCKVIWPTWFSFKIGPILRREKDKRFYNDLFVNKSGCVGGLKKIKLLITKKHISEKELLCGEAADDTVTEFTGFENCFSEILRDSELVKSDIIKNLNPKWKKALDFNGKDAICMHVRLGDFSRVSLEELKNGKHCSALPIEWYVRIADNLRDIVGKNIKIYVFSDGTDDELADLLKLPNTERFTTGSAIGDILALSTAGVFIASGSSFSMWARYLGRMTTIMFPNQVKQEILLKEENSKEIVALDEIDKEYYQHIKKIFL